jgi:hypothetical protein
MLAATALAVGAVGAGGLVTAPSASAQPNRGLCGSLMVRYQVSLIWAQMYEGAGMLQLAATHYAAAAAYLDAANDCNRQS